VLAGLRQRRPFCPFTVVLRGGAPCEINDPGELVLQGGAAVWREPGSHAHWFDHESVSHILETTEQVERARWRQRRAQARAERRAGEQEGESR
jgi:hypothetical protein